MKRSQIAGWLLVGFSVFAFAVALAGIWGGIDSMVAWQLLLSAIGGAVLVSGLNQIANTFFKSAQ